jgi:hypothetical protein
MANLEAAKNRSIAETIAGGSGRDLWQRRDLWQLSPTQILEDDQSLKLLLAATTRRTRSLSESLQFFHRINRRSRLRLLLDADVVRKYMSIEDANEFEGIYIRYFFEHSSLPYALPIGAFQEILRHLGAVFTAGAGGVLSMNAILDIANKSGPLEALSALLNIDEDVMRDPVSFHHLSVNIEKRMLNLARLVFILTNPRFEKKLYAEYDHHLVTQLGSVLEEQARYMYRDGRLLPAPDRDLRDKADAINMAICYGRSQSLKASSGRDVTDEQLVLLTTTRAVLNSADAYDSKILFVTSPRQIAIPDHLGINSNWSGGYNRARALRNKLRDLEDIILDQLDPSDVAANQVFRAHGNRAIDQILHDFRISISTLSEHGLHSIETSQKAILAVEHAHRRQVQRDSDHNRAGLAAEALSYVKILDRVVSELKQIEGVFYETTENPVDSGLHYQEHITRIAADHTVGDTITTRLYYTATRKPYLCTCQWDIDCDDIRFLRALDASLPLVQVFTVGESIASHPPLEFPVIESSESWRRGAVITTSIGSFGITRDHILSKGSWSEALSLSALQGFLRNITPNTAGNKFVPEIQEIRINTDVLDIVFDVVPSEYSKALRITILSRTNENAIIAELYDVVGSRLVLVDPLRLALDSLLSHLPGSRLRN